MKNETRLVAQTSRSASIKASPDPQLSPFAVPALAGSILKSEISNPESRSCCSPRLVDKHSVNVFSEAAPSIAAMDFYSVLNRFDSRALSKRLQEKPELFFQLIASFCQFSRTKLQIEKFEFKKKQAETRQREREQKLRARKPIRITRETITSALSAMTAAAQTSRSACSPTPTTVTSDTAQTIQLSCDPSRNVAQTLPSASAQASSAAAASCPLSPSVTPPNEPEDTWHDPVVDKAMLLVASAS